MKLIIDIARSRFVAFGMFAAVTVTGLVVTGSGRAEKDDDDKDNAQSKVQIGFREAPVPLNLVRKNRDLVGLGSYIVNVVSECNGCHSSGPATEYVGNPYLFAPPSQ